jgi:hypothetical protein
MSSREANPDGGAVAIRSAAQPGSPAVTEIFWMKGARKTD